MPTFYHGSAGLFTKPDISMIPDESFYGTNEYGWGFYASDYGGDAWEYIEGTIASKKPAFIYEINIDDDVFKRDYLVSYEPISSQNLEKLIDALDKQKGNDKALAMAETYRNRRGEEITTSEIYNDIRMNADMRPKEASEFFVNAGFSGYLAGSYMVFMDTQNLPEFGMRQAYNYGRDAEADYELIKRIERGDKLSDYASEQFAGRIKSVEIRSEMARSALWHMQHEQVPVSTIEKYLDLIELSEQSDDNGGYDIRNMLGHAVCRGFMIHPRQKDDAYFGTNIANVIESFQKWRYDAQQIDGFMDKLGEFVEELKQHPKVRYCVANAPVKKSENKVS